MATIDTKIFKASSKKIIKIISTSDHASYWKFGYDALMITNTAHYRNPNYHKRSDTMETLNIPKMMQVIDATALASHFSHFFPLTPSPSSSKSPLKKKNDFFLQCKK